jgi:gluconolactonase
LAQLEDVEVLAEGLAFPEGPVALPDGAVIVGEIRAGRLTRIAPDGTVSPVAEVGGGPNGAAVGPDGALYVCNNGGFDPAARTVPSIQRVDPDTGQVEVVYQACEGQPLVAPNDLVFDHAGGFWFTDYGANSIYYARPDGSRITRAITHATGPNGVGLAPAGDVVYWAQTTTRQVHRRRLSAPGTASDSANYDIVSLVQGQTVDPWTLVVGLPGAQELDSLAVESSGAVCVGTLVDSGITVVFPEDGSTQKYTLPDGLSDAAVTNICFGGADLRTAYITLSLTGKLISCRWPRPGLRLAYQDVPILG